ncbi:MAG: hypothetical protein ACLPUT_03475 [Solirubrobacteraceae bacterium]
MSILPQLERDLLEAANHRLSAGGDGRAEPSATRLLGGRGRGRRLRLLVLAFGCVLATATIALAATGVILTGAPVRPEGPLNPSVGEGVPAPGASRLLPLRVPDPEGGPPWGMRIVRTTRGEVCEQVGRVQDGQLGELGIDGVFHDDGRFHPMSADVLSETSGVGRKVLDDDATESVSCQLAGQVTAGEHLGVDRSAGAADGHERAIPRSELRDVSFGVLGRDAVSVSYRDGAADRTDAVLAPIGAYLIVQRIAPHQQVGSGYGSLGTEGDLLPSAPLTAIAYRLDGRLCQRGPILPPGVARRLADPCPQPHRPAGRHAPPRDLHEPLRVQLQISHDLITGVQLSFTAPLAVTSAREDYEIRIPDNSCDRAAVPGRGPGVDRGQGYGGTSLDRDVARGSTVTQSLSGFALFSGLCGRPPFTTRWTRRSATLEVLYRRGEGEGSVLVGSATVRQPPGTRPEPEPVGPRHRHAR